QLRQERVERQLAAVVPLQRLGQHDRVDRRHAQVAEEQRRRLQLAGILPPVPVAQDAGQLGEDVRGGPHPPSRSQNVVATTRSPPPLVQATRRLPANSGSPSPGPPTPRPVAGSAERTTARLPPTARATASRAQ